MNIEKDIRSGKRKQPIKIRAVNIGDDNGFGDEREHDENDVLSHSDDEPE